MSRRHLIRLKTSGRIAAFTTQAESIQRVKERDGGIWGGMCTKEDGKVKINAPGRRKGMPRAERVG